MVNTLLAIHTATVTGVSNTPEIELINFLVLPRKRLCGNLVMLR